MIIVMKLGATDAALRHAEDRLREFGLTPHLIVGAERTIMAATGKENLACRQPLKRWKGWRR